MQCSSGRVVNVNKYYWMDNITVSEEGAYCHCILCKKLSLCNTVTSSNLPGKRSKSHLENLEKSGNFEIPNEWEPCSVNA